MSQAVPASLRRRFAAVVYDLVMIFGLLFVATLALFPLNGWEPVDPSFGYRLYLLVLAVGYYAGHWHWLGRTPGMRAWRLRVETPTGGKPDMASALRRFAGGIVSTLPGLAGFFAQLLDADKRTWHDRLSDTRLVHYPKARTQ